MSESMLEKVRKLLALAERTNNKDEREAFNNKAAELIAKYGIDELNLTREEPLREGIVKVRVNLHKPYVIDKASLLNHVGLAMRCKVIRIQREDAAWLIGFEKDVERVELVFSSLLVQMAMGLSADSANLRPLYEDPRTYAKSWFGGFIMGVYRKLRAAERQAASEGSPGTDLAVVDRKDQVARWVENEFSNLRNGGQRQIQGSGYGSGLRRGTEANVGTTSLGKQVKELR